MLLKGKSTPSARPLGSRSGPHGPQRRVLTERIQLERDSALPKGSHGKVGHGSNLPTIYLRTGPQEFQQTFRGWAGGKVDFTSSAAEEH